MTSDRPGEHAVRAYVERHGRALLAAEPGLRAGDDVAVHDARTATRRLRTALSVYEPLVGKEASDTLRAQLAELGHLLGAARDPVVERHAFGRRLRAEPLELVRGPVALRLDEDRSAAEQAGLDGLRDWLASDAWAGVAGGLLTVVGTIEDGHPDVVRRSAGRAWRRFERAARRADGTTGDEHDEALHDVRKAARRARYASEIAAGVVGKAASRSAKRARRVQEALGVQHDAVVRRETLRRVAHQAFLDGEDTFTYGRLDVLDQVAAEDAERTAAPLIEDAVGRRHRRWTR